MLALQSKSIDWFNDAELEISDGTTLNQFYGSTPTMNVVDVMDELAAWATSTFAPSFGWSWQRDPATGGAVLTLYATAPFTLEATTTAAQTGYGLTAGVKASATSHTFDAPAIGTWAPVSGLAVSKNIRILGRGDACGNGAIRPGVPGLATYTPSIEAIGTAEDAGRLTEVLADASNPRRMTVYQQHTGLWLDLALGDVSRSSRGAKHYRFQLTASGEAL